VVVGVFGPEAEMAVITLLTAIGFDLEQRAKNVLEQALSPRLCNVRAAAIGARGVGSPRKDEPHNITVKGWE
jgi:hypothetical protein